jgi:alkyl sulfatase BDS1-like metallo-beta-lactamase superfamily hydrolase
MMKNYFGIRGIFAFAVFALGMVSSGTLGAEGSKGATEATKQSHAAFIKNLPFSEKQDFADAGRGLVARLPSTVIRDPAGNVVWDMDQYIFLNGDAPIDTINPSLRRQAALNNIHGLFKVTDRIYQVRGYDLANMGIVVGDTGYIIIDPLTSVVTTKAAIELLYEHAGKKPIVAVLYSHSHADHWAGVKGLVSAEAVQAGQVRIIAPVKFMEEAVSENILAGNAMIRRGQYMHGALLPRGPRGQVDAGLGKSLPRRLDSSLIQPTDLVGKTGMEITIDGVRIVFQHTPGTEAPANMNFYFPQFRALFMADNCVSALHNLLTPRGAPVRDAKAWAGFIYEAIDLFGETTDVVFLGHNWPRWGRENVLKFLKKQGDVYKYIHDQTLRLANHGYTPIEIAEQIRLPGELAKEWFNRDYYATLGWNAKAVYQHYLGWYDGNPANFNPLPPVEAGKKYVEFMGGAEAVLAKAKAAFDKGDYRWVAQVVNHVVFADPENERARNLQADTLEQLGYQSESAVFRNFYLFGAKELRDGVKKPFPKIPISPDLYQALTLDLIFDGMAVRLNGPKAAGKTIAVNWQFTDSNERYALLLENGVLNYKRNQQVKNADVTIKLTRTVFNRIITGQTTFLARLLLGDISHEGSIGKLNELMAMLDEFDLWFNIVTP